MDHLQYLVKNQRNVAEAWSKLSYQVLVNKHEKKQERPGRDLPLEINCSE